MTAALQFAAELIKYATLAAEVGMNVHELLRQGEAAVNAMVAEGRDPTDAEWEALNIRIAQIREKLHSDDA